MILVDTSAWIAFFRNQGSAAAAVDVPAGRAHLKPLADRTACGACETYGTWTVTLPVLQLTVRAGRYLPLIFQLRHVYAMPAAFAPVLRDVEELSTRFLPFALAR